MRKTMKDIQEAGNNPTGFVVKEARSQALLLIVIPYCFALLFIILFFIAGYITGDGSGFFRVLFWIFFLPFLVISYVFYIVRKALIRLWKREKSARPGDTLHTKVREVKPDDLI